MEIWSFVIASFWLGMAAAQTLDEVLRKIPTCAVPCLFNALAQSPSPIDSIAGIQAWTCLNMTLQREVSACTQMHCNYTDQVAIVEISQPLCAAYPIPSRAEGLRNTAVALIAVVVTFIVLRLYSKYLTARAFWWDDWTIIVGSILAVTIFGMEIAMSEAGFGLHVWNVRVTNLQPIETMFYASQLMYIVSQVSTKISILLLYLRIFSQPLFQKAAKASIVLIALHAVVFIFITAFQCIPTQSIYTPTVSGRCLNKFALVLSGAIASIVQDFLVIILPIPCIKTLKIKTGKRIGLIIMFSVGSFACITSILRLRYVVGFGDYTDPTWDNTQVFNWSCIELATAIVCTCLPSLRALLSQIAPGLFGKLQTHKSSSNSNSQAFRFSDPPASRFNDASEMSKSPDPSMRSGTKDLRGHDWTRDSDAVALVDMNQEKARLSRLSKMMRSEV